MAIVRLVKIESDQHIELVISDTKHGARLRIERFPWKPDMAAELAEEIAKTVNRTRLHFGSGIKRVFAIQPFVSRNLTHEFDRWQMSYPELIANALMVQPGVAVIEIEEAKTLAAEHALTDGKTVERHVPLIVEGSFRTTKADGGVVNMEIEVAIVDASKKKNVVKSGKLKIDDSPTWIATTLTQRVLDDAKANTSISISQQVTAFGERAAVFSRLGSFERATELRESCLLLMPSHRDQRIFLIEDLRQLYTTRINKNSLQEYRKNDPILADKVARHVERYVAAMNHLEYLIRNRLIDTAVSVYLAKRNGIELLAEGVGKGYDKIRKRSWYPAPEQMRIAERAKDRFLEEVFPQVPDLPSRSTEASYRMAILNEWQDVLIKEATSRTDNTYRSPDHLKFIKRILSAHLPEGIPTNFNLLTFLGFQYFNDSPPHPHPRSNCTKEQWMDFMTALVASDNKIVSLYARYGLIAAEMDDRIARLGLASTPKLLEQADALLDDIAKVPFSDDIEGIYRDHGRMYQRLLSKRNRIAKALNEKAPPRKAPDRRRVISFGFPGGNPLTSMPPMNKAVPGESASPSNSRPITDWRERMQFRRPIMHLPPIARHSTPTMTAKLLNIQVYSRGSHISPLNDQLFRSGFGKGPLFRFTRCGDVLDVFWNRGAVLFMREKDKLDHVFAKRITDYVDVKWDGEHVWVTTKGQGVWVVKPDGEIVATIDSDVGLPETEHGVFVEPIAVGKALITGSFGPNHRGWCAIVNCDKSKGYQPTVNLFHRATYKALGSDSRLFVLNNPNLAYIPTWTVAIKGDAQNPPYALVGRKTEVIQSLRPLRIDLNTLDVTVSGFNRTQMYGSGSLRVIDGYLLSTQASEISLTHVHKNLPDHSFRRPSYRISSSGTNLIQDGDWIYQASAATAWLRVNMKTLATEVVKVTSPHPNTSEFTSFGNSLHYGMIGLYHRQYFQLNLESVNPKVVEAETIKLNERQREQLKARIQQCIERGDTRFTVFGMRSRSPTVDISRLTHVTQIGFNGNDFKTPPPSIGKLTNLESVLIQRNQFETLPVEFGNLTKLSKLTIVNEEHFKSLPASIGNLTSLKVLMIRSTILETLPPEIGKLKQLEQLRIGMNEIRSLPKEIGKHESLQGIDLGQNRLTEFQPALHNLTNLKWLILNENEIDAVPVEIGNMTSLETLALKQNRLTSFPSTIGKLTNLRIFDVSYNDIETLPDQTCELANLEKLFVSYTQVTRLPEDMGKLTKLTHFYLRNCAIGDSEIDRLSKLKSLKLLDLRETNFTAAGVATLKASLPKCTIMYNS